MSKKNICLKICEGRACKARFSDLSAERAEQEAKDTSHISVERCGCLGDCEKGPNVVFKTDKEEAVLNDMTPIKIGALFKKIQDK